jgi:hypothetical protein
MLRASSAVLPGFTLDLAAVTGEAMRASGGFQIST